MRRNKIPFHSIRRFIRRHSHTLRSLLIVVLVVTLAAQCWRLWSAVLPEQEDNPASLSDEQKQTTTDNSAAALPIRFAARSDHGLYGVEYNTDGLEEAYEATADIWAQALERAGEPAVARMEEYRSALKNNLLLMEYDGRVPVHILAGWLNCNLTDELEDCVLGTMALCSVGNHTYLLYFRDSSTGTIRCAQTSVDEEAFDAATEQFEGNDCALAVDEEAATVSPDLLYFYNGAACNVMSFAPYDGTDGMNDLLTAFGMDAEVAQDNAYTSNGMKVYVSGANTVRMSSDGRMVYDGAGIRIGIAHGHDRIMQCVQTGYRLTMEALDAIDSGAMPALTRAYTDADTGRYIVVFGIQMNSIPVDNTKTGYFARYEFEGSILAHADLALRTSQSTGETIAVMPEKQAAAGQFIGADMCLSLRYIDEAEETDSTWAAYEEDIENNDNEMTDDIRTTDEENNTGSIWDGTDAAETGFDEPEGDTLGNTWYNSGTAVSPQWYVLQYGEAAEKPEISRTISPENIVVVYADFDRLIRGGAAA
ncbi:MAG: hypothetical protein Q4C40_00175 [Eubacteriales bacterium]|nr:hypothetical protein [Eubacteriales bacterium]